MNDEEFRDLINKYLAGDASAAEENRLFEAYDALQEKGQVWESAALGEEEETRARLYGKILQDIKWREKKKAALPARWAVAASLLLAVLAAALFLYRYGKQSQAVETAAAAASLAESEVKPGGNKAVLTLGDGSKIILDSAANGELARQAGIRITKTADGQLLYIATGAAPAQVLSYNTIETPKGGQYRVVLPDSSEVWLNAASSLRYPTRFAGGERRVELVGEAYFEVTRNRRMPFRVVSQGQTVEVLGTHFNISAYPDEAAVKTTLLEGAVKVLVGKTNRSELLAPGQQAAVSYADGAVAVQPVAAEEAVAWKNGYFVFDNEGLESLMRKLARWYDVQIVYEGEAGDLKFGGMVSRSNSIGQTLRILELTGDVTFKVKGRRVLVMP
ncbi:FecR family protein [Pontibacter liquoris]|uniref:FecR family protein n=1 Tax=Pontibacter liquoris TaxID=2905677 RepID=UPI001FA7E2BA|nr:FecR domain-containing protein [Pontibacter liquoris]